MDAVARVTGLSKRYGGSLAVDGISFEVARGEIFGLLGPNGAGKTSTLECLEGLRRPTAARSAILGVDPRASRRKLRNLIGVQLQTLRPAGHHERGRGDALLLRLPRRRPALRPAGAPGPGGEARAPSIHSLSTGQQRRLALALAVAHKPPLVFWTSRRPGWTWARAPSCTP